MTDWSDSNNVFWKWDVERYYKLKELLKVCCTDYSKEWCKRMINEIVDKYPSAKLERIS